MITSTTNRIEKMDNIKVMCESHHGVYIPQVMTPRLVDAGWANIRPEDVEIIAGGPDNDDYWEAWNRIVENAEFSGEQTVTWKLYLDGDLFAYCPEKLTPQEHYNLFGEYPDTDM